MLAYLVQHHGLTISKQQLIEHVWKQEVASDWALARCIKLARKILGDNGRLQQIIKTLYGDGYCFVAFIEEHAGESTLSAGQVPPPPRHSPQEYASAQAAIALRVLPLSPYQENPLPGTVVLFSGLGPHMGSVARQVQSPDGDLVSPAAAQRQALWQAIEGQCQRVTILCGVLAAPMNVTALTDPGTMPDVVQEFFTCVLREVQRSEGIIHHFTDKGFTAVFGALPSGGDHPWQALLAAMRIQGHGQEDSAISGVPRGQGLQTRMGVHTGDMVRRRIGADRRLTYIAVGDTMQLATRLMHHATPGTLLLSHATSQRVQQQVHLEIAGAYPPDTSASLPVYQVLAVKSWWRAQAGKFARPPQGCFVGREPELALLHALLQQVERGRGQMVGIVGEFRMGKSRFLAEFRRSLRGKPVTYLAGRCRFHGRSTSYLPVCDLIRHFCRITEADRTATIAAKVRQRLVTLGLDPAEQAPYLLRLLGLSAGTERLAGYSPEALNTQTAALLCQMSLQGSQQQPLVLVVEDMHWIDPLSAAVCTALIHSLKGAPLMLLMTYRPGYQPAWLAQSSITQIALQPLLPQPSATLVRAVCGTAPLHEAVEQRALAQAEGNPFLLEELTRAAVAQALHMSA